MATEPLKQAGMMLPKSQSSTSLGGGWTRGQAPRSTLQPASTVVLRPASPGRPLQPPRKNSTGGGTPAPLSTMMSIAGDPIPPPATAPPVTAVSPADWIVVKIEAPTKGIAFETTKKFKRNNTMKEIVEACLRYLPACVVEQPFNLFLKRESMEIPLAASATIGECDIMPMDVLCLVPESERCIEELLSKANEPKKMEQEALGAAAINTQYVKSGFMLLRHGLKGAKKRRWCVLKETRLYWFKREKDKEADGFFDLDHSRIDLDHPRWGGGGGGALAASSDPMSPQQLPPAPPTTPAQQQQQASGSGLVALSLSQFVSSSSSTSVSLVNNSSASDEKGDVGLCQIVCPDGSTWTIFAEGMAEAKAWYAAFIARKVDESTDWRKVAMSSVASGYVIKKRPNANIMLTVATPQQRRWAVLSGTRLFFAESPASLDRADIVELFSTKIVHNDEKHEILFTSIGAEGVIIQPETESLYLEWVKALRKQLPLFVSSAAEELSADFNTGQVVKSGYMMKKKVNRKFSTAKKRWFVLKGNKMYYSKSSSDSVPLGCLDLLHTQANFYILDEETDTAKRDKNAQLELITTGGVYSLSLPEPSEKELADWAEQIKMHSVGMPFNVVHKQHVDFDYNWTAGGVNPAQLFEFQEKLGEGAYATVFRAKHRDTGFELAIKILKLERQQTVASSTLQQEIDVLKRCRSPQVVSYFGTCTPSPSAATNGGSELWIMTEICGCGSVKDLMKCTFETLNERQLAFVVTETLKGLTYLHHMNIVHHDIKSANILLTEECQVKLADFGVSQQFQSIQSIKADDFIGSPLFMSPEVLRRSRYNNKTDIWSLGITIIEMAEGQPPNTGITSFEKLIKLHEQSPPRLSEPETWSPQLNDFVRQCLIMEYEQRPDPITLLHHEFLQPYLGSAPLKPLVAEMLRLKAVKKACPAVTLSSTMAALSSLAPQQHIL